MKKVYRIILFILGILLILDLALDYFAIQQRLEAYFIPSIYLVLIRIVIVVLLFFPKKLTLRIASILLVASVILSLKYYLSDYPVMTIIDALTYTFFHFLQPITYLLTPYHFYIALQILFTLPFLYYAWFMKKPNPFLVLLMFLISFFILILWVYDFASILLFSGNLLFILTVGFQSAYITFIGLSLVYYAYFVDSSFDSIAQTNSDAETIDPVIAVLFSIFSLFIWYPFWIFKLQKQINLLQKSKGTPLQHTILCIIIPFYFAFWSAYAGHKIHQHYRNHDQNEPNHSALYFLMSCFQLGLSSMVMIQTDINRIYLMSNNSFIET